MNLFAGQERDTDVDSKLVDIVGEGEGGMNREEVALTCIHCHVCTDS